MIIEHQQYMHRVIKHSTHRKQSNGIKYIEIPINNTIPWNSIPSSLPEDKWKRVTNLEDTEILL